MSLKVKTFAAVRWTTLSAVFRTALQLSQIALLARLLSPEDYGLMAMIGVIQGFVTIFSDLGMNAAYLQRQEVTQPQRSSLFWLNVATSVALAIGVICLSPLIAMIFEESRLTPLLILASSIFVLHSFGQQLCMDAEKRLHFRPAVILEILSAIISFIVAVLAALAGWGVYALLAGSIAHATSNSILAWLFLSDGWRPEWRLKMEDIQSYLGFGGALVINNIVNRINMSIDLLLGGRLLGAAELGLYSVPRSLVLQLQFMINPIITKVGFPLIAQVQHDVAIVRSIFLKTLNMTASVNAPLYIGIAFFSPEVVSLLLGDQWIEASHLLTALAIWGFLRSTLNPVGSLLLGMGRADLSLKWNTALLFLFAPALWAGSQYGAIGLAFCLLTLSTILFVPAWYFLVRPLCNAQFSEYSVSALRPFLISLLSIGPTYILTKYLDEMIVRIVFATAISTVLYIIISYVFNREWFTAMRFLLLNKDI